jgi:predicted phosphodiesterase
MAFVSDIHGNLTALEAVLDELRRRDVGEVYAAGDHLLGGDEPLAVWRRLVEIGAKLSRGTSDEALAVVATSSIVPADDAQRERLESFLSTRRALGELVLEQLRRLPDKVRIPMMDGREIVMTHGSPADPHTEISFDMSDDEILSLVEDDPGDIFVVGGTHVPFQRELEELHVVNVGSVGAAPEGRVAHFTIITPRLDGAVIEQSWVEY